MLKNTEHPSDTCIEKAREAIHRYAMFPQDARVLAAVSGGPDSMSLIHVLRTLGYQVEAGHFDHQTRSGESARDAAFVQEWTSHEGISCHMGTAPVSSQAITEGRSFEEAARRARYAFLFDVASRIGAQAVATGHHADDQAETVLMRLLRGSSPQGLAGIPPIRLDGPAPVARPLFTCTREEILAYAQAHGLPFREDASNQDFRHSRNRIRHELLPLLEAGYNPRVRSALVRLGELERAECELITEWAFKLLEHCLSDADTLIRQYFIEAPLALRRRVLIEWGYRHGAALPFAIVDAADAFIREGLPGHSFDLGGGWLLHNARAVTEMSGMPGRESSVKNEVRLDVPGQTTAFGQFFTARILLEPPGGDLRAYCSPQRQVFNADEVGTHFILRRRRPGDRFMPFGLGGTKKLKDYFSGLGLPHGKRDAAVILDIGGRIAWVAGMAVDARFAVTRHTHRIVEVEVSNAAQ